MHGHHTPKNTSACRLPKIKNHHRKSTSGSQKSSRKSKIITERRLPEVKNHHRKSTSESQKTLRKSTSVYKKKLFYLIF